MGLLPESKTLAKEKGNPTMITIQEKKTRVLYMDYLRILATLAVIIVHVTAKNWDRVAVDSYERQVFLVYNLATGSWPIGMFMMLSGALFLDPDRQINTRSLYTKNIIRLVTAFLFWSAVYAADQFLAGAGLRNTFRAFLNGYYHMWYLFMAIAYYISVPVFRKITESKKVTQYFLVITFCYLFLGPSLVSFLQYFQPPYTGSLTEALAYYLGASNFGFGKIFAFYFVLGLYLHKYGVDVPVRKAMIILGPAGYLGRLFLTKMYILRTGSDAHPFDFCIFDLALAVGIFLFAKYVLEKINPSQRWTKWTLSLSKYSFGAYLVHALVIDKLQDPLGLTTLSFEPVLSVPVISVLTVVISFGISWLLHQIPVLKKYVV